MGVYKRGRPYKFDPKKQDIDMVPNVPGEYRICDKEGNRRYIGETCNIRRRMKEHIRVAKKINVEKGDYFEYKIASESSTSAERRIHERQKIAQHKPQLNCSKGGEGRVYVHSPREPQNTRKIMERKFWRFF